MPFTRPEPLADNHDLSAFASGVDVLDDWLRRRARANQVSGASHTFVVAKEGRVVGYSALASGAITVTESGGRFRRNMPDPILVAVLGRLAVDQGQQGRGARPSAVPGLCSARCPCGRHDRHPRHHRPRYLRAGQGLLLGARLRSLAS